MAFVQTSNAACFENATNGMSLLTRLAKVIPTYRQRQALRKMDARSLADIGVSQHEADVEIARKLWDIPANRF